MAGGKDVVRLEGETNTTLRPLYEKALREGACALCNLDPSVNKPVFEEPFAHWNVWWHPAPERGTSAHIMMAPKEHYAAPWDFPEDVRIDAQLEFFEILQRLAAEYGDCFSTDSRIGATPEKHTNAGRIYGHLNWHFIVSDGRPIPGDAVSAPVRVLYKTIKAATPHVGDKEPTEGQRREHVKTVAFGLLVARDEEEDKSYPIWLKHSGQVLPA